MTYLSTLKRTSDTDAVRGLLTLKEAIVLAEVAEDRVRKDIETGVLKNEKMRGRNVARWMDVFAFAAIYNNEVLTSSLRKVAFEKITWSFLRSDCHLVEYSAESRFHIRESVYKLWNSRVDLTKFVYIDMASVIDTLVPRLTLYANGLAHTEEDPEILNGTAVFKGTRLSVRHIGTMLKKGERASDILEDYPYLSDTDLKFSEIYTDAHPPTGRPRKSAETVKNASSCTG